MMLLFALIYLRKLRIHPLSHSSLLESYQDNIIPNRITPPPHAIEPEDGPKYEDRTWEPVENVANARALLEDFHLQYPDKPGPQSKTTHNTHPDIATISGSLCHKNSS